MGFEDAEQSKPITPKSRFRIGSITKTYTATVVLKLIEQGKLRLEQKLADFFPQVPNSQTITIEQLLRHESGLFSLTDNPDFVNYMYEYKSEQELVNIIEALTPKFSPGDSQEYSNSNFILLGFIAQQVTNKPLSKLIDSLIIEPLELSSSYLGMHSNLKNNEVASFSYRGDWQVLPNSHLSIPSGAGAMISTAEEVSLFASALFSGMLLSPSSLKLMTELKGEYGLGLMSFPFQDKKALGHGGAIDGYLANMSYFGQEEVSVAVLCSAVNCDFNDILNTVFCTQFDREFELPEYRTVKVALTSDQLCQYVGTYSSSLLSLDINVFIDGETLMAQATGQEAFALTPFGGNEFRFDAAGITFQFEPNTRQCSMVQGGGKYLFEGK